MGIQQCCLLIFTCSLFPFHAYSECNLGSSLRDRKVCYHIPEASKNVMSSKEIKRISCQKKMSCGDRSTPKQVVRGVTLLLDRVVSRLHGKPTLAEQSCSVDLKKNEEDLTPVDHLLSYINDSSLLRGLNRDRYMAVSVNDFHSELMNAQSKTGTLTEKIYQELDSKKNGDRSALAIAGEVVKDAVLFGPAAPLTAHVNQYLTKGQDRISQIRNSYDNLNSINLELLEAPDDELNKKVSLAQGGVTASLALLSLAADIATGGAHSVATGLAVAGGGITASALADAVKHVSMRMSEDASSQVVFGNSILRTSSPLTAKASALASTATDHGSTTVSHSIPFIGKIWALNSSVNLIRKTVNHSLSAQEAQLLLDLEKIYTQIAIESLIKKFQDIDTILAQSQTIMSDPAFPEYEITRMQNLQQCVCDAQEDLTALFERIRHNHALRNEFLMKFLSKPPGKPTS